MGNQTEEQIIDLLHTITQKGYMVQFAFDFEGMMRLDFFQDGDYPDELNPNGFYEHDHVGYPGCEIKSLTPKVKDSLLSFIERRSKDAS